MMGGIPVGRDSNTGKTYIVHLQKFYSGKRRLPS